MLDKLDPVHFGHAEIGDEQIGLMVGRVFERIRRLRKGHDLDIGYRPEDLLVDPEIYGRVINGKDMHAVSP